MISQRLFKRFGEATAIDLPDSGLRAEWLTRPGPRYLHADAEKLPFRDDQFDVTVCVEVLEHLVDPQQGLRELARVTSTHLLVSVPREPIFRGCNLITGRYVKDLGNTPGHFNHWSTRSFTRFLSQVGTVREVSSPSVDRRLGAPGRLTRPAPPARGSRPGARGSFSCGPRPARTRPGAPRRWRPR